MSKNQSYYQFGLKHFKYKSAQDLYEKLFLAAIVDTYARIDKTGDIENNIRDRFIWDMEKNNPITKNLIDNNILLLDFERQHFVSQIEKRRTDIVFFISGFEKFILECKCLHQQPSKNQFYIDEGVKRFVEHKYAEKSQYAGMIGFVVSGSISEIFDYTQNCVSNFYPSNYALSQEEMGLEWNYCFKSSHNRINNTDIIIYHLMFPFLNSNS
jgi:hypothetical protein